jgi:hypothetical protein
VLYRLFPYDPEAPPGAEGDPLYVPRALQGQGRHDNPAQYGALYASRQAVGAVAEHLQRFRRQEVGDWDLRWERGLPYALAALDDGRVRGLVDLDDPSTLAGRDLRPSRVATRNRERTQELALDLYREGGPGFAWWSTIEAAWINVTLFWDRARELLAVEGEPEPLTVGHPAVRAAAEVVEVRLG